MLFRSPSLVPLAPPRSLSPELSVVAPTPFNVATELLSQRYQVQKVRRAPPHLSAEEREPGSVGSSPASSSSIFGADHRRLRFAATKTSPCLSSTPGAVPPPLASSTPTGRSGSPLHRRHNPLLQPRSPARHRPTTLLRPLRHFPEHAYGSAMVEPRIQTPPLTTTATTLRVPTTTWRPPTTRSS